MLLALVPLLLTADVSPPEIPSTRHVYSFEALAISGDSIGDLEAEDCFILSTLWDSLEEVSLSELDPHFLAEDLLSSIDAAMGEATASWWERAEFTGSARRFKDLFVREEVREDGKTVTWALSQGIQAKYENGSGALLLKEHGPPQSFGALEEFLDLVASPEITQLARAGFVPVGTRGEPSLPETWRLEDKYVVGEAQYERVHGRRVWAASWHRFTEHSCGLFAVEYARCDLGFLYPSTLTRLDVGATSLRAHRYRLKLESVPSSAADIAFSIPEGTVLAPAPSARMGADVDLEDPDTWPAYIRRILK